MRVPVGEDRETHLALRPPHRTAGDLTVFRGDGKGTRITVLTLKQRGSIPAQTIVEVRLFRGMFAHILQCVTSE